MNPSPSKTGIFLCALFLLVSLNNGLKHKRGHHTLQKILSGNGDVDVQEELGDLHEEYDDALWKRSKVEWMTGSLQFDEKNATCQANIDLVLALDSSETVDEENWQKTVEFAKSLVAEYNITSTRFGIVQFNSIPVVASPLQFFPDNTTLAKAVEGVYYKPGGTRIDLVLSESVKIFANGGFRPGASRVLLLVTDRPSNNLFINNVLKVPAKDLMYKVVADLKANSIATFAVAIEDGNSDEQKKDMKDQLTFISAGPEANCPGAESKRLFTYDTYDTLKTKQGELAKATCIVNGGWAMWSDWSDCSLTCGGGTRVRHRTCDNPKPDNGGSECAESGGFPIDIASCNEQPCTGQHPPPFPPKPTPPVDIPSSAACPGGFDAIPLQAYQMSASTVYSDDQGDLARMAEHSPANGRLGVVAGRGAWCAEHSCAVKKCKDQYLQIDLGQVMSIGKVAIQGQHFINNYVTNYKLRFSRDGTSWEEYTGPLNPAKDSDSIVQSALSSPATAKFVQFNPQEWGADDICMRVGVYTCKGGSPAPAVTTTPVATAPAPTINDQVVQQDPNDLAAAKQPSNIIYYDTSSPSNQLINTLPYAPSAQTQQDAPTTGGANPVVRVKITQMPFQAKETAGITVVKSKRNDISSKHHSEE